MLFNSVFILVGLITETYLYGGRVVGNLISMSIGYILAFTILNPFFYNLDKDIKSPYQYLEKRYDNKTIRIISALVGLLFHLLFISLQLWGCATILATIFPKLKLWIAILTIGSISTISSLFSGLKQSVKVSILQFILTMLGIISALVISFSYNQMHSPAQLWEIADKFHRRNFIYVDTDLRTKYTIFNQLFSLPIPWCAVHAIYMPNFTKYRSISSKIKSKMILISHLPVMLLVNGSFIFSGIACFVYFYNCDPIFTNEVINKNQIATLWILKSLSKQLPSIAGFCLASVIYFSMSQYSIGISLGAKLIINEILNPIKSNKLSNFKIKIFKIGLSLVIGILTFTISIRFQYAKNSIISLFYVINNSINSPTLGLFILSMCNPYANWFGATLAFVCNLSITLWLALGSVAFSNLKIQEFPPNTFGCLNETFSSYSIMNVDFYPKNQTLFYLYSISAIWYCLFSLLFNLVFGSLFSFMYSIITTKSLDSDSSFYNNRKKYILSLKML